MAYMRARPGQALENFYRPGQALLRPGLPGPLATLSVSVPICEPVWAQFGTRVV